MADLSFDPRPRRAAFRALHEEGCFVLPNPWDAGSARYLHSVGFQALASTSSGYAWSQAQADGTLTNASPSCSKATYLIIPPRPAMTGYGVQRAKSRSSAARSHANDICSRSLLPSRAAAIYFSRMTREPV